MAADPGGQYFQPLRAKAHFLVQPGFKGRESDIPVARRERETGVESRSLFNRFRFASKKLMLPVRG